MNPWIQQSENVLYCMRTLMFPVIWLSIGSLSFSSRLYFQSYRWCNLICHLFSQVRPHVIDFMLVILVESYPDYQGGLPCLHWFPFIKNDMHDFFYTVRSLVKYFVGFTQGTLLHHFWHQIYLRCLSHCYARSRYTQKVEGVVDLAFFFSTARMEFYSVLTLSCIC